jgi:hypothetical protein
LTLTSHEAPKLHHPCPYRSVYTQVGHLTKHDAKRLKGCWGPQRKRWRAWRKSYAGYWRIQVKRQPGVHMRLAGLRYCESTGRYHISGAHDGAYQYLRSTWARAQWWVPYRYRTAAAHLASVDHQDAVTGRFYPSHAGEWACSA